MKNKKLGSFLDNRIRFTFNETIIPKRFENVLILNAFASLKTIQTNQNANLVMNFRMIRFPTYASISRVLRDY